MITEYQTAGERLARSAGAINEQQGQMIDAFRKGVENIELILEDVKRVSGRNVDRDVANELDAVWEAATAGLVPKPTDVFHDVNPGDETWWGSVVVSLNNKGFVMGRKRGKRTVHSLSEVLSVFAGREQKEKVKALFDAAITFLPTTDFRKKIESAERVERLRDFVMDNWDGIKHVFTGDRESLKVSLGGVYFPEKDVFAADAYLVWTQGYGVSVCETKESPGYRSQSVALSASDFNAAFLALNIDRGKVKEEVDYRVKLDDQREALKKLVVEKARQVFARDLVIAKTRSLTSNASKDEGDD